MGSQPDSTENFDTFGQTYHTVSMRVETPISTDSQSNVKYVYKAQLKEVTTADFLHGSVHMPQCTPPQCNKRDPRDAQFLLKHCHHVI